MSGITQDQGTDIVNDAFQIEGSDGTNRANVDDNGRLETKMTFNDDDAVLDMTNRLRVTQEVQYFSGLWNYDKQPLAFSESITGTSTLTSGSATQAAYLRFNMSTTSGDKITFGSKRYLRYEPNKMHTLTFANVFGAGDANQVTRIGLYDDLNGMYWANLNGNINIGYRNNSDVGSGTTETNVTKANWNFDNLDGTGPSGLNISEANLLGNDVTYYIDFLWHGANGIIFGIKYFNKKVPVHRVVYTATDDNPFLRTAILPFRAIVENTGTLSATTLMKMGPMSYTVSGGALSEFGYNWAYHSGNTTKSVTGTVTNLLALRCKSTFNSLTNRGIILPNNIKINTDNPVFYEVFVGCNVSGGTWTSVGTNSIAEYNEGTFTYTGGRRIIADITSGVKNDNASALRSFQGDLFVANDAILGVNEAIVVRAVRTSSNATVSAGLEWREVY